jgi:hypothetical protein
VVVRYLATRHSLDSHVADLVVLSRARGKFDPSAPMTRSDCIVFRLFTIGYVDEFDHRASLNISDVGNTIPNVADGFSIPVDRLGRARAEITSYAMGGS